MHRLKQELKDESQRSSQIDLQSPLLYAEAKGKLFATRMAPRASIVTLAVICSLLERDNPIGFKKKFID